MTTETRHDREGADVCFYHSEIASGFLEIKQDLKWFGSIGRWILGVRSTILGFMVLQGILYINNLGKLESKVDMLVLRADRVTEINKQQNDKIEALMLKMSKHDEQIEGLKTGLGECSKRIYEMRDTRE